MEEKIEKYFLNKMDPKEKVAFLQMVETNPELQKSFIHFQNTNALFAFSEDIINKQDTIRCYQIFNKRVKQRAIRKPTLRIISYAAAVALLVLTIHYYHVYFYPNFNPRVSDISLSVPAGQRINLTLEDGTKIWLNSQTRITYPTAFTGKERRVSIEGEAYFEVAKDKERPFIVSSQNVEMKVLGTEFNVCSYPQEGMTRVSLIEGSIQVYCTGSPETKIQLYPAQEIIVCGNKMEKYDIDYLDYFQWTEGILCFNNEPLSEILKKLELCFDTHFEVLDPSILEWRYTVKFRQSDGIHEILRLMHHIHAFKVVKDEKNNKILLSK